MKEKRIFFVKNVSEPSNPPDELAQNVSKKIPFGRIVPPFFLESSESDRFSIVYMIRIRFFGPGELIQKYFRAARYVSELENDRNILKCSVAIIAGTGVSRALLVLSGDMRSFKLSGKSFK